MENVKEIVSVPIRDTHHSSAGIYLATDMPTRFAFSENGNWRLHDTVFNQPHHLYVVSDEVPQVGDWYLVKVNYGVGGKYVPESLDQFKEGEEDLFKKYEAKKVIGTSNDSLGLPILSHEFQQLFCKNGGATHVIWNGVSEDNVAQVEIRPKTPKTNDSKVRMFLFGRWMSTCYLEVLNQEDGKWWAQQLGHFNENVYPQYIENGTVETTKEFLEDYEWQRR